MRKLPLADASVVRFEGAVDVAFGPGDAKPWRLPLADLDLHHPDLRTRAESPAGVRLVTVSDAMRVRLRVEPQTPDRPWVFDLVADGKRIGRVAAQESDGVVDFGDLPDLRAPRRARRLELFLPTQYVPVRILSMEIDDDAVAYAYHDPRPRWVMYGSSITHAKEAFGPSETWAALVADRFSLHLTNLGYGGQEHNEPLVGRMIANLPADLIGICTGGNIWYQCSYSPRTYKASLFGLLATLRDKHPDTPIALCSFISSNHDKPGDAHLSKLGLPLRDYRSMTADAAQAWIDRGDRRLFYVHGPDLFGDADLHLCDDGVHPNGEGQYLLSRRFGDQVMTRLMDLRSN